MVETLKELHRKHEAHSYQQFSSVFKLSRRDPCKAVDFHESNRCHDRWRIERKQDDFGMICNNTLHRDGVAFDLSFVADRTTLLWAPELSWLLINDAVLWPELTCFEFSVCQVRSQDWALHHYDIHWSCHLMRINTGAIFWGKSRRVWIKNSVERG